MAFGICIGMTALPVLGALLNEMGLLGRRIGHLALGIAGINDAVLWIVLGLLLTAVAGHAAGGPGVIASVLFVPAYLLVMTRVVRPLLGGMVVVLEPGADKQQLRAGGEIPNTQGAVPLSELIAKFMFGGTGQK